MPDVRLIDANALEIYKFETSDAFRGFVTVIPFDLRATAPTIDAVPVVRCRECVHNEDEDVCPFVRVNRGENWFEIIKPHPDGFCHMGAKMDGGAD